MNRAWGIGGRCERSYSEEVISARSIVQAEVGGKKKIGLCKLMNDPSAATASFLPFILVNGGARNRGKAGEIESARGDERPKSCSRSNRGLTKGY